MRKVKRITIFVALVLACAAAPARAQGYFAPFIGYDFGGDAGTCPSILNDCSTKKSSYGLTVGGLSGGILGFEEDIGYAPDFFGQSAQFGDNSILTLMSNLVVGLPLAGVRPYVSGGLGLMRTRVSFGLAQFGSASGSQNALAYDIGGGLMLFLPHHLGVRGDYRYFRSTKDFSVVGITINNPQLSFSRVSVGLVLH